jgi:phosphatidylglycerol---prolipoprotein diacylglyceryl transferase
MSESGHLIHDLDPKLIHIYGDIGVSYYGLAYVLTFVFGIIIHRQCLRRNRTPFTLEQEELVLYAAVLGVLLGARVGYVILYALPEFFVRPWFIFEVWHGGMSFHGGFIGLVFACWYINRRTGVSMLQFSDLIAPMAPIGLLLGRIANFINGELWGLKTDVWWAVVFPRSGVGPIELLPARHPSQLYEAALEGAVLLVYLQLRYWKSNAVRTPGKITGEFMVFYAIFRIFCEMFREPDASLIFGMSRGTFYSVFIFAMGIFFWVRAHRRGEIPYPVHEPATTPTATKTQPKSKKKNKK